MKNKILILSGDPNSINSELIYKSWKAINPLIRKNIYFISNYKLLHKQFLKLNYPIKLTLVDNLNDQTESNRLKIFNIDLKFKDPFNVQKRDASKFILNSLDCAHKLALQNNIKGIINCSINKKLLIKKNIGVTEYLSKKCGIKNNSEVMLIRSDNLAVSPVTTHIDVKNISNQIKSSAIINKIKTIEVWFRKNLNRSAKFGVLGLNPHNAELRKYSEEKKIIMPAIKKVKKMGINVKGPLVADTLFVNDYTNYDIILGMYHDQVLAPFKAIYKFNAINVTLGLKYLRASPDHGTAADIIGKNIGKAKSLINCIKFINKFGK
jgi:4-hydroxy-L-threonine phosphate dehydrogenase PdxA